MDAANRALLADFAKSLGGHPAGRARDDVKERKLAVRRRYEEAGIIPLGEFDPEGLVRGGSGRLKLVPPLAD